MMRQRGRARNPRRFYRCTSYCGRCLSICAAAIDGEDPPSVIVDLWLIVFFGSVEKANWLVEPVYLVVMLSLSNTAFGRGEALRRQVRLEASLICAECPPRLWLGLR
jgi:hypothetical protein